MNLAFKMSVSHKDPLSREVLRLLNEIHFDFERSPGSINEVITRTGTDVWLVARKTEQRELYVILDSRYGSLTEVNDEINRLNSSYFGNIFID